MNTNCRKARNKITAINDFKECVDRFNLEHLLEFSKSKLLIDKM